MRLVYWSDKLKETYVCRGAFVVLLSGVSCYVMVRHTYAFVLYVMTQNKRFYGS